MHLLFDIGGTKSRFATSEGNELKNIKIVETPQVFDQGIQEFKNYVSLLKINKLDGIAGGIAGPLDNKKSMVLNAPNLPGWNNMPFKEELFKYFNTNIKIENDAALNGVGEATKGAGRDKSIVMFLTISTGVGGGRIVNGKIDENAVGFEPGHQYIPIKNSAELQSLEAIISGTALKNKYHLNPDEITDEKIWNDCAYYLALGIHNSILHWSPEVVVLGGSIMNKISIEKTTNNLNNLMDIFPEIPEIKNAELGDKAGLYGAITLL